MKNIAIAVSIAALFASVQAAATPLSRDQVVAEYAASVADGSTLLHGDAYAGAPVGTVSTRTREEVRADLDIARQRGEVLAGEHYPVIPSIVPGSGKTRAEVRAELDAARRSDSGMALEGRL